ncbi:efflux RND transporter periplasmic adaptor subunit [Spirochaeta africana]|uniref:RND family efflux transporter, MFP subunit n=1 Tax=Spirochaeta africana (strain ATCC 700263 / DSM 8902 / Z-7692) TaxID=889378 RepID=H9ULF3_SPIAZ|nr:efflux RND transporter periplasmic adaptor subunit [Spirochaeta africana]AFG38346.1 RND family efflux transporter, MFP subunit [Spirochaeta africana DSM 8902]
MNRKKHRQHGRLRRKQTVGFSVVVIGLAVVAALYAGRRFQQGETAPDLALRTEEAVEGTVGVSIENPAQSVAHRIRVLRAGAGGEVAWIAAPGYTVSAGDPLVEFAPEQAERRLELARIAVQEARIQLAQHQATREQAARLLQERESLAAAGAVSSEQVQSARDQLRDVGYRVQSAELSLERARLSLVEAQQEYASVTVKAPFDGTVLSVSAAEGDWVGQNSSLLSFGDVSRLRFTAEVDEYDISRIVPGMPVNIRSVVMDGNPLRAEVVEISPEAEIVNNIALFRVSAVAENPDNRLKPGMTADMAIVLARDTGVVIPSTAVSTVRGRSYVEVQADDGTVESRRVEPGADDGNRVAVLEGLSAGERVIVPEASAELPSLIPAAADQTGSTSIIPVPGSAGTSGSAGSPGSPGGGSGGGGGGR